MKTYLIFLFTLSLTSFVCYQFKTSMSTAIISTMIVSIITHLGCYLVFFEEDD